MLDSKKTGCCTITGEVAADVVELLIKDDLTQ
jgi:hypothetical protein